MKKIYMLDNSQGVIRTLVGLKSRIDSIFHRVSSDSILSRICLVSLILLLVGGFSTKVWGGTVQGYASVIEGKGSVKVQMEVWYVTWTLGEWRYKSEGSVVDQNAANPSSISHSSKVDVKRCKFVVVSKETGYTFGGWYKEESNGSLTYKTSDETYAEETVTGAADRTYTYRAKFSPIAYTISFNSNPGTGTVVGSTADVTGVKYDQDATLTPNGYQKIAYVVTYDANGGSGLSKTTDKTYYDFEGWTKDNKTYTDGATVRNLSSTDGGTATLYAKWGSGTSSITLPPAPSVAKPYDGEGEGEYTFAGWYLSTDGTQTVIGVNGDSYTPTANVTLKAKWTAVKVPAFSAPGFVEGAKTLTVGGTYSSFIFDNVSTSTPSSLTSAKFYYEIFDEEVQTDNTDGCLEANKSKVISFDGTTITALNKGTAKIAFYQKEDTENNIEQRTSDTYTINVDKNVPSITFASAPYYYNATINNFYSSDNSATSISAESDNTGVASISGTTLTTYNKAGTAQITVSQAENYYWAYHEESVDVTPQSKANHVTYTITNSNYEGIEVSKTSNVAWITDGSYKLGTGDWGTSKPDDNVIISLEGIPDKLSFTLSCDPVQFAGTHYPSKKDYTFEVYESATNGNWGNKIWGNDNSSGYSAPEDVQVQLSTSTRYIKLRYTGTCWGHFENIQVTELQYFRRQGENSTLDFATNVKDHVPAVQSFIVEHANAGYQTSVTAPAHYLVSTDNVNFASEVVYSTNASAKTAGDKMGTFTVYVKYLADAEGTHNANVTVHNNLRSDFNVPVTGTTQGKLSTTLHYIGASAYNADTTNLVATDLFEVRDANSVKVEGAVITLTTGTASSVILANDAKSIAELCGNSNEGTTGNVVASYAGDNTTYAAATNNGLSQNFTINRLNDEVSFDSGYESMVVGEEIDLTEWATSCTSGSDITVTSVFKDYIVIEDGKVKAVAKGNGRLRAASAGNCTYNSGVKFLNIAVRNADDPCGSAVMYSSKLIKVGAYSHTSSSPVTYTIPDGPQDKLTFKVWKVPAATQEATLQILDKNENVLPNGTINYGAGSLSGSEPDAPNKEINMANYPGAKKLRFYGGGTLNKYFSEVRISQKAYLTASTSSVTMSTVQACDTAKGQFTVDYSDVSHIQLSQTNNDFSYEVWEGETKLIGFENGCKSYGTYTVKFFYVPQAKGGYSNKVTLSASGKEQVITLSGTANKPDREIVWDIETGNTITATQSLDLTAYARTACEDPAGSVYYTASPAAAVTIEGNHITFDKAATVTVTAHTVASDDYNDALAVDKVWTVGKVNFVMQTLPTIESTITYGDNSSVVTWKNDWVAVSSLNPKDTIPGTIAYVGPASFNAAGDQNLTFNFTPSDLSVYDANSFTVPVTVQKMAALNVDVPYTFCAGESVTYRGETYSEAGTYPVNATGANRDTVYNVIVTVLQPTTGTDSKTITYGENESWHGTDLSGYTAGEHEVEYQTTNAVGCDSTVTLSLTVNKATPTLSWETAPAELAYNATDVVYAATSTSNEGDITYSITSGSEYAEINATTGALTNIVPGHNITVQATQAVSTNYNAPVAITVNVTIAAIPTNTFTNAHGDNDWQNDENWSNGVPTGEAPNVIVSGALSIDENVTVGNLTIENTGSIAVITGGTLTVKGTSEYREAGYGDVHVLNDGAIHLGSSADLQVRDFTLDAKLAGKNNENVKEAAASGQVGSVSNLHVNGDAYFQMTFDPKGKISFGWYDFVVPFPVNISDGIFREGDLENHLVSGVDFLVQEYNETKNANKQKAWSNFYGTMQPGRVYTITFNYDPAFDQNVFVFKKASGTTIGGPTEFATQYTAGSGDTDDFGWNGLGNGTLQHGYITGTFAKMQVYNHGDNKYDVLTGKNPTFAVGTSFFVQVGEAHPTMEWNKTEDYDVNPLYAPKRENVEVEEFLLSLREEDQVDACDHLYVSASEEATEAYVIGHDLRKMGNPTEAKAAQMWTTKNGKKLCDIELPMNNSTATCELNLCAPNVGQYLLSVEEAPENTMLYLTYNGRAIWNLTYSPYALDLAKGTTEGYGLKMYVQQVTTDIENGELLNGENGVRKVLIDDVIYIITPEGKMYDITGKSVNY